MKTSVKILSLLAVAIIIGFVVALLLVRKDLRHYLLKTEKEKYKTISTDTFKTLNFSANWDVQIRQGKHFKVQLVVADSVLQPDIKQINGSLYLKADTSSNAKIVHARIIAPTLHGIVSEGATRINIEEFESDSLTVFIGHGSAFSGRGNHFKFTSFQSSGNARIELTQLSEF